MPEALVALPADQGRKEALPPMSAELHGAASSCKASPAVGADGFHPEVPLGLGIIGKRWSNAATGQFKSARFSFIFFRGKSRVRDQLPCCPLSTDGGNGQKRQ